MARVPTRISIHEHWECALHAQLALSQRLDVHHGQLLSISHPGLVALRMYSARLKSIQCALESAETRPLALCMENAYHHFSLIGSPESFVTTFMCAYDRIVPAKLRTHDMEGELQTLWTTLHTHLFAVWSAVNTDRAPFYHALRTLSDSLWTIIESIKETQGSKGQGRMGVGQMMQASMCCREEDRRQTTLSRFGKILLDLIHTIMPQSEASYPASSNGEPGAKVLILWESRLLVCMELILEHGSLQVLLPCLAMDDPTTKGPRESLLHAYNIILTLVNHGLSSVDNPAIALVHPKADPGSMVHASVCTGSSAGWSSVVSSLSPVPQPRGPPPPPCGPEKAVMAIVLLAAQPPPSAS
jgi:hypothetical protein